MYSLFFLLLCSCGDPDDEVLDGDLITAITGPDQIYSTAGERVNYEYNPVNSTSGSAAASVSAFTENSNFSMRIVVNDVNRLDLVDFNASPSMVDIRYQIFDMSGNRDYVVDLTAVNSIEIFEMDKNRIEGVFEVRLVNSNDPTDMIQFNEGYFYVYD